MKSGERKSVGEWSWNSDVLWSRIVKTDDQSCHAWTGSRGPQTNLFGAQRLGQGQMTQARRILYRDVTGEDCDELQIRMNCGNPFCMNFLHIEVKPNQRRYYLDGTPRGSRTPVDKQAGLQRRALKTIDKEWYLK
jgi:hypothetical protein